MIRIPATTSTCMLVTSALKALLVAHILFMLSGPVASLLPISILSQLRLHAAIMTVAGITVVVSSSVLSHSKSALAKSARLGAILFAGGTIAYVVFLGIRLVYFEHIAEVGFLLVILLIVNNSMLLVSFLLLNTNSVTSVKLFSPLVSVIFACGLTLWFITCGSLAAQLAFWSHTISTEQGLLWYYVRLVEFYSRFLLLPIAIVIVPAMISLISRVDRLLDLYRCSYCGYPIDTVRSIEICPECGMLYESTSNVNQS